MNFIMNGADAMSVVADRPRILHIHFGKSIAPAMCW